MTNYHRLIPIQDRFWSKVDKSGECWIWTAARNRYGYGVIYSSPDGSGGLHNRMIRAHRFSYESVYGAIPAGLQLDHLCRNPPCVRPDHLEAVTNRENSMRAIAAHPRATHCKRGHEFTPANELWRPTRGRQCRICFNRSRRELRRMRTAVAA